MDVHTQKQRSFNMSHIRSKDTKPEIMVRKIYHSLGYRFRLHRKDLPGKPDLAFPKYKVALFVNGCFWHSHDCKWGKVEPKTHKNFWILKRSRTVDRDKNAMLRLRENGWEPQIVWECETRDQNSLTHQLLRIVEPHSLEGSL